MSPSSTLDVRVTDSPFDADGTVRYRRQGEQLLYRVRLCLDGWDLPYVQRVTYVLPASFDEPVRTVERTASNPNCELELWTSATFPLIARIQDKRGPLYEIRHMLTYGDAIQGLKFDRFVLDKAPGGMDRRARLVKR